MEDENIPLRTQRSPVRQPGGKGWGHLHLPSRFGADGSAEHSLTIRPSTHGTEPSMTAAASEAKETNP